MTDRQLVIKYMDSILEEMGIWRRYNFPDATDITQFLGVVEEVGELSHALLKKQQEIRESWNSHEQIVDAVGDIMIFLFQFCEIRGLNPMKVLFEVWDEVKKRDWKKYPKNGVDK